MAAFSKWTAVGLALLASVHAFGAIGPAPTSSARAIERRMNGIVLPKLVLGPPATIIDAVDFLRQMSKDFDRSDVPEDRRGVNFVLRLGSPLDADGYDAPVLSQINASNVSLYDALKLICNACTPRYAFKIQGGAVVVAPTTMISETSPSTAGADRSEAGAGSAADDVKIAVDYLLGRNGRQKDVKTGIRLLVAAAEQKPIAKRVFVRQWLSGNLDGAMDAMTVEEWAAVLDWFKEAYDDGEKRAGLLLGRIEFSKAEDTNRTDRAGCYVNAAKYWRGAGRAGCAESWYRLGNFVFIGIPKPPFEKPKTSAQKRQNQVWKAEFWTLLNLKLTDKDAQYAYLQALKLRPDYAAAKFELAMLRLFSSDKKVADAKASHEAFAEFYDKDRSDKWNVYYYGLSGYWMIQDKMNSAVYQKAISVQLTQQSIEYDIWRKRIAEYNSLVKKQQSYVAVIERAAKMGCRPAQNFMASMQPSE